MLNLIVGPERMRRLLREYIRVHQFGHATTDSFLSTLNAVTSDMKDEVNYSVAPVEFVRILILITLIHFLDVRVALSGQLSNCFRRL